ncbi:MAG: HNH endonuclease [Dactylosporangium sp.]|nr:HNH endonuclease [Dactylosporangium sp.]
MPQAGRVRTRRQTTLALAIAATLALGSAGCDALPADPAAPSASASTARAQLAELTVASPAAMRGYSRDRFPHWRDAGRNCDTRDVVLKRDGQDIREEGCNVVGGRWLSPYDNTWHDSPSTIDIDHIVPLANAWRSGANTWDDKRRGDFANDLDRPQLLAVSRTTNRAKGDQDPSQWKPPNRDYWCTYAQDWIAVKHHWELTVTSAEKQALADMLETCP